MVNQVQAGTNRVEEIVAELERLSSPENRIGMARYGIDVARALGVGMTAVRALARTIGRDHDLALALWETGYNETRILASLIADPRRATDEQLERWVAGIGSWDVCDGACGNYFRKTPQAHAKAMAWASREETFVKRAGFALMASLAVHDRGGDEWFRCALDIIAREAGDTRNFVKKAANWALRQIGKRNLALNEAAIETAERIVASAVNAAARWVASDALRELKSDAVRDRLDRRAGEGDIREG